MVRIKKRYFVIQFELVSDIKAKKAKRALSSVKPLPLSDAQLFKAVRELVTNFHGDHGLASVTHGLRTIYCNPMTRLVLLQVRHGPHRLVGSVLPFLTKIEDRKVVPRLLYTGATIRHSYKFMENHQRNELDLALQELEWDPTLTVAKEEFEKKMTTLRPIYHD